MNTAILQAEQFGIGTILLRLCLALLCGGIIGLERAKKHQSAGFRTYMLVCLGSTLTMLLGQYEYYLTHIAGSGSADVSRLGAQVINGIRFYCHRNDTGNRSPGGKRTDYWQLPSGHLHVWAWQSE